MYPAILLNPVTASGEATHTRWRTLFALSVVLLGIFICGDSWAQTSLDSTTTGIDTAFCSIMKIMQKFAFYALIVTIVLIGIAIKMDESKGLVTRAVQILVGVWVILNVFSIADLVTNHKITSAICSSY